jgi:hypothetical protein
VLILDYHPLEHSILHRLVNWLAIDTLSDAEYISPSSSLFSVIVAPNIRSRPLHDLDIALSFKDYPELYLDNRYNPSKSHTTLTSCQKRLWTVLTEDSAQSQLLCSPTRQQEAMCRDRCTSRNDQTWKEAIESPGIRVTAALRAMPRTPPHRDYPAATNP